MSTSAQGDEQLLDTLLDRPQIRTLIRFATRGTGVPISDEDLEQEVILRILRASQRVRKIEHPKAFAGKIVSDAVNDYWRRRRKVAPLNSLTETLVAYRQPFEDEIDRKRTHERLHRCLRRLSTTTREIIELFYIRDCSVNEVSRSRRLSRSAVKMALLRGRQQLRRLMTKRSP